jgi:hypothetical protein
LGHLNWSGDPIANCKGRGIDMNKTRKKRCNRKTQLSRLNQSKYGNWQGITLFECEYHCLDCELGNPTHNPFHHPHTTIEFVFNGDCNAIEELRKDYTTAIAIEHWFPREIKRGLNGLFPKYWSWTQLAISRSNELSR